MPHPSRTPRWTLALVSAGGLMMTLDVTVVNVALPGIARDLGSGLDAVRWTVSAYSLAFGALLLSAGALSDRTGRRAVFTAGMALFTLASAACGLAPDAGALVAARAVQGVGGALAFAPTLALIAAAYEGARRQAAIAAYAALASAAGALGPVVGGVLVQALGWRWIFLVNVPIGVLVVIGALARMPESAAPGGAGRRADPLGALLGVGALLGLHYALTAGPDAGWTAWPVPVSAGAGVVLGLGLVASQRRGDGLVDLDLLRIRAFAGAAVLGFLARLSGLGVLAFVTLWFQGAHGYSPLETGLRLLPLTGSLLLAGLFTARLQRALPASTLVACGFTAQGLGLLALAASAWPGSGAGAAAGGVGGQGATASYPGAWQSAADTLWPGAGPALAFAGLVAMGVGAAVIFPPLLGVAVGAVPADRAGMASGLTNACHPLGTATGVAVLGALFSARLDGVPGSAATAAGGGAVREAVETGRFDLLSPALRPPAEAAFSAAFAAVCLAAALVCLLGALTARTLRAPADPAIDQAGRARSRTAT